MIRPVILRELRRMTSRRIYFASCIGLPLFALVFMATLFGNGRLENLPVGVVDGDNTSASRNIIRMVDATPALRVAHHYANEAEAWADVRRREIYGWLSIPSGFEAHMGDGEETTLCYYYHNALMSVGGELHATFGTLLKQMSVMPVVVKATALGMNGEAITSFLMPVAEEVHPLYNPRRDYSVYLSQPFFFVMLQVLVLLTTTYALGSEGKFGTADEWMRTAGGNIALAVAGKLIPYTLIYIVTGILANYVFFGWMHIPLPCSLWAINGLTVLFLLATQALAVFLFSLFPAMSLVISVVSMVGSLGATLSGVTFPVSAMYAPVRLASHLFPVRHYVEAVQTLLYRGGGFSFVWTDVVVLLLFLLPPLFLLPHLKRSLTDKKYEQND